LTDNKTPSIITYRSVSKSEYKPEDVEKTTLICSPIAVKLEKTSNSLLFHSVLATGKIHGAILLITLLSTFQEAFKRLSRGFQEAFKRLARGIQEEH
jgi:hypothetical protein